jgi:putative ABC transport system permease protein
VDPGFRSEDVLTAEIAPPPDVYGEHPDIDALHATLHRRLESLPGVESVASVSILPMGDNYIGFGFSVEGRPPPEPGQTPSASIRTATPGYFRNVGIALLSGRGFVVGDRRDAPPVVVVSRSMARRWWPEEDPVGERIEMRGASWEIVGVVADARQSALGEPPEPAMYVPFAQSPSEWMNRNADLVLRTSQEPADLILPVRDVLRSVDSRIPILGIRPMEQVIAATTVTSRFRALLLCVFAGLALLIGAVGVFGVLSHQVARRRGEMAVRMAVGAPAGDVLGLVMRRGMGLVVVGVAVGILGAIAAARFISSLLFGIRSTDPPTFVAIALITLVVAALACYLPARRAAAVDPMTVLREE